MSDTGLPIYVPSGCKVGAHIWVWHGKIAPFGDPCQCGRETFPEPGSKKESA